MFPNYVCCTIMCTSKQSDTQYFFSFQLSEEPVKEKEKQVEKKEEIVGVGTLI